MNQQQHNCTHHGFSILELVIVLGIIALIAGAGLTMATGALKAADRVSTQERLNTLKLALDSYAKTYGHLPCPAKRDITPTDPNFGVEARNSTTAYSLPSNTCASTGAPAGFTGISATAGSGVVLIGAVPVRTLGLPDNYAGDAWNNKLTYAVSSSLTTDPTSAASQRGSIIIKYGKTATSNIVSNANNQLTSGTASSNGGNLRVTYGSTTDGTTGNTITTAAAANISSTSYKGTFTPSAVTGTTVDFASIPFTAADAGVSITWQSTGKGAAYVVVSHGPDARGAYPMGATAMPANKLCNTSATANSSPAPCTSNGSLGCIDINNCNDDNTFFDTAYNDGAQTDLYFDDYVVSGTTDNLRVPFNTSLYTSNTVTTCPTGTCESWCAACTTNYPGNVNTVPGSVTANATLCRKIISSNATTCTASCFWAGTTAAGVVECP